MDEGPQWAARALGLSVKLPPHPSISPKLTASSPPCALDQQVTHPHLSHYKRHRTPRSFLIWLKPGAPWEHYSPSTQTNSGCLSPKSHMHLGPGAGVRAVFLSPHFQNVLPPFYTETPSIESFHRTLPLPVVCFQQITKGSLIKAAAGQVRPVHWTLKCNHISLRGSNKNLITYRSVRYLAPYYLLLILLLFPSAALTQLRSTLGVLQTYLTQPSIEDFLFASPPGWIPLIVGTCPDIYLTSFIRNHPSGMSSLTILHKC